MGVVYLAIDHALDGRQVAVKILPKELEADPRALARLKREATTAMEITHPNVMRLINYEESGSVRFLVMEYIDGPDFLRILAGAPGGKLDVATLLHHADGICAGVAYAHARGVVHSDLKPSNIVLASTGEAKITDFGVAQVVRETMTRISHAETAGTLLYMSPELLGGEPNTPLSDQYALGITFYELLTGEPPFIRGDITDQHRSRPVAPIPDVPHHVNDAILRALAKRSGDRWPDVERFRRALVGDGSADWHERATVIAPSEALARWAETGTITTSSARARATGRLFVKTDPPGARVLIDEMEVGTAGALISDVAPGDRAVRVTHPQFVDLTRNVTIEPNRITRLDDLVMEPAKAIVNIISDPPDAAITFDGRDAGRTPQTLDDVEPGEHPITLVKPEYVETTRTIRVEAPVTDVVFELEHGAVEFRGRWLTPARRAEILRAEEESERWQAEETARLRKLARRRRWWVAAAGAAAIGAVLLVARLTDNSAVVADFERRIEMAVDSSDFDGAAHLVAALREIDEEAAAAFPQRIQEAQDARAARFTGQIEAAIASGAFGRATELAARLRRLDADAAEQFPERIRLARERQQRVSELAGDLRTAWLNGSVARRDVVLSQLRALDADNEAVRRYSGPVAGELIRTLSVGRNAVRSVAAAGSTIVSASDDLRIRTWGLASGRLLGIVPEHVAARSVAIAGDRIVSGSSNGMVETWSLGSGQLLRRLVGHTQGATSVAVADGRIVSGSADRTIRVWDLDSGQPLRSILGHQDGVRCVAADAGHVVSGSYGKSVRVWDMNTGQLLKALSGHTDAVLSVAIRGGTIVSGSADNTVRVWNLATGQLVRTLSGHTTSVTSVAIAGERAVSGSADGTVRVWDIDSGALLRTLPGHDRVVLSVAVVGDRIISGSEDGTVKVWQAPWE